MKLSLVGMNGLGANEPRVGAGATGPAKGTTEGDADSRMGAAFALLCVPVGPASESESEQLRRGAGEARVT